MNRLTVDTRITDTGLLLKLAGELDFHTAAQVRQACRHIVLQPGQQLVVDLAGLTMCDSSGITTFLLARNRALDSRADIALAAVPDHLARIFRLIGLDQVFTIHLTVEAAAEAWRQSSR